MALRLRLWSSDARLRAFRTGIADLRQRAAEHRAACDSSSTVWQQFLHHLLELLYHVASGALVGLLWGYSSHLAMDATTAASLPLFA